MSSNNIDFTDHPEKWEWAPYFTPGEFACHGSGECLMHPEFMQRLYELREAYGKPMIITSGYRSPDYNKKVAETGSAGPHTTGRAADIAIRGTDAYMLLKLAMERGFTGIGVQQKGESRFMHLDDITSPARPNLWSY